MELRHDFKVNNFDLLRLLAATEVIFDHYFQHLNIQLSPFAVNILYLFPGVPVFFIISGYLISASYERNSNIKNYFRNRALRIYPGLWGCILISVLFISLTGINFFNRQTIAWLPAQFAGFIYTPGFLSNYGFGSYNGSLWTIPIELQFYIALPILYLLITARRRNAVFMCLLPLFWGVNIVLQFSHFKPVIAKLIDYSFIPHFHLFLFGVLLQRLQVYKHNAVSDKGITWLAVYLCFCLGCYDRLNPVVFEALRNFLLGFVVISVAYTLPLLSKKVLRGNDVSYGVYMYHGLVLTVLVQLKYINGYTLPLLLLLTLIMAVLSWRYIERPCMKIKSSPLRKVTG